MKKIIAIGFMILCLSAGQTYAQDLDAEVTDIKMRALSGAKSKWSSSIFATYAGASLKEPLGAERPNPGDSKVPEPASTAGNIGLRYRINKYESLYFATGFYQERSIDAKEQNNQLEVSTPQIIYNHTMAIDDLQLSTGAQLMITTQNYMKKMGDVGSLGLSMSTLNQLGDTRLSGGVSMLMRVTAFDKSDDANKKIQSDYGFSFTPSVQFNQTQKLNYFTSLNLVNLSHYRSELRWLKLNSGNVSQTLGLGYAIFRDFYLSPYISFEPQHTSLSQTAVNLTATINL